MSGCLVRAEIIGPNNASRSSSLLRQTFGALKLGFKPGDLNNSEQVKQAVLGAINTAVKEAEEENNAKSDQHKQDMAALKAYSERKKAAEARGEAYTERVPTVPNPELTCITEVIIDGSENIPVALRADVLKCVIDTMKGDLTIRHLSASRWEMVAMSTPGQDTSAMQLAARTHVLEIAKSKDSKLSESGDPFRSFMAGWLSKNNQAGSVLLFEDRASWFEDKNNLSSLYLRAMGSLFLQEVIDFLGSFPPDTFTKQIDRFRIRATSPEDFERNLRILAKCERFPFNLTLVKDRNYRETYDENEFSALLALIVTAHEKGIRQIDFANAAFTPEQLEELLDFIKNCTKEKRPICRLENMCELKPPRSENDISWPIGKAESAKLQAISAAYLENYTALNRHRILAQLSTERLAAEEKNQPGPLVSSLPRPAAAAPLEREVASLEVKQPSQAPRASKQSLKDLHAQISKRKAGVQIQVQQQVQSQLQLQTQLQQALHHDVSASLQTLDAKDFIDYAKWKNEIQQNSEYNWDSTYGSGPRFNAIQRRILEALRPKQRNNDGGRGFGFGSAQQQEITEKEALWFEWTLNGLALKHNLEGFTKEALKQLWPYFNFFRDGFDIEALPPGVVPRMVTMADERGQQVTKRLLAFDPAASNTALFGIKLKELQTSSTEPVEARRLKALFGCTESFYSQAPEKAREEANQRKAQLVTELLRHENCYSDYSQKDAKSKVNNHGCCPCPGCAKTPASPQQMQPFFGRNPETEEIFGSEEALKQALGEVLISICANLESCADAIQRNSGEYFIQESLAERPDSTRFTGKIDRHSPFYSHAQQIALKWKMKLIMALSKKQGYSDLELPLPELTYEAKQTAATASTKKQWKDVTESSLREAKSTIYQKLKPRPAFDSSYQAPVSAQGLIPPEIIRGMRADQQALVEGYKKYLEDQRAAAIALLWGDARLAADIEQEFPVLRQFSLRHLRMLLEIALKFDLKEGDQKQPDASGGRVFEALLNKLTQIQGLDKDQRTFNNLFKYVLDPSDNWQDSLILQDSQLEALSGLCELSEQDRINWNWLLERHGGSVGYADLHTLFADFQLFNREYARLTNNVAPLDFSKFSPDSVRNGHLLLRCLWVILNNARSFSIADQVEALRGSSDSKDKIIINQWSVPYASRHQGFGFVCVEAGLEVARHELASSKEYMNYGAELDKVAKAKEAEAKRSKKDSWGHSTPAYSQSMYGARSTPVSVDYRVSRSQLIEERGRYSNVPQGQKPFASFYRYLCLRERQAGLSFSFYRNCVNELQKERYSDSQHDTLLALLAITSANDRAADFKEADATRVLWERLKIWEAKEQWPTLPEIDFKVPQKKTTAPATPVFTEEFLWDRLKQRLPAAAKQAAIDFLVDLHKSEDFEALSFVEAATLIELLQVQIDVLAAKPLDKLAKTIRGEGVFGRPPLTNWIEAAEHIRQGNSFCLNSWEKASTDDERRRTFQHKENEALTNIFETQSRLVRNLLTNATYRAPFLRVVRQVYAQTKLSAQSKAPLPLADYLAYAYQLTALFDKKQRSVLSYLYPDIYAYQLTALFDKKQRSALSYLYPDISFPTGEEAEAKEAPKEEALDPKWTYQLFAFINRIAPSSQEGGSNPNDFFPVISALASLHKLPPVEGHSIAKRLISMLSLGEMGYLSIDDLSTLFAAAQTKFEQEPGGG